jgi:hypothetical protein
MQSLTPIQSDFLKSWDEIENFYNDLTSNEGWEYTTPLKNAIRHLRAKGYDKIFRAGKSVYILIISRTKTWEMKSGQHRIVIEPTMARTFKVCYTDVNNLRLEIETPYLIENKEFYELLNRLMSQPVE